MPYPEFATAEDHSAIQQLLQDCGLPHEDIGFGSSPQFLVVRTGKQLQGAVGIEVRGTTGLLRSLAVLPASRGRGIGSILVKAAEDFARSQSVQALYLLTTTAEKFFEKHGYVAIDRNDVPVQIQETSEFRSVCPESAVCMTKWLSQEAR